MYCLNRIVIKFSQTIWIHLSITSALKIKCRSIDINNLQNLPYWEFGPLSNTPFLRSTALTTPKSSLILSVVFAGPMLHSPNMLPCTFPLPPIKFASLHGGAGPIFNTWFLGPSSWPITPIHSLRLLGVLAYLKIPRSMSIFPVILTVAMVQCVTCFQFRGWRHVCCWVAGR